MALFGDILIPTGYSACNKEGDRMPPYPPRQINVLKNRKAITNDSTV